MNIQTSSAESQDPLVRWLVRASRYLLQENGSSSNRVDEIAENSLAPHGETATAREDLDALSGQ